MQAEEDYEDVTKLSVALSEGQSCQRGSSLGPSLIPKHSADRDDATPRSSNVSIVELFYGLSQSKPEPPSVSRAETFVG